MNRQRHRPSSVRVDRARRIRPAHAARHLSRADRRLPAGLAAEEAALAFLTEILVGDRAWTLREVRSLISMRESAELGRWQGAGPENDGASPR
jgi:hypothetical protein